MTNFEKLKSMTQDEAVAHIRDGFCEMYKECEDCSDCPMGYAYGIGDYDFKICISDFLADWLEAEVQD